MKDGRTHLAHKAEHAVDMDMDTGATVAVTIQPADRGDTRSIGQTLCFHNFAGAMLRPRPKPTVRIA